MNIIGIIIYQGLVTKGRGTQSCGTEQGHTLEFLSKRIFQRCRYLQCGIFRRMRPITFAQSIRRKSLSESYASIHQASVIMAGIDPVVLTVTSHGLIDRANIPTLPLLCTQTYTFKTYMYVYVT